MPAPPAWTGSKEDDYSCGTREAMVMMGSGVMGDDDTP